MLCSGNVFADNAIYFIIVCGIMKFLNNFLCIKTQLLESAFKYFYYENELNTHELNFLNENELNFFNTHNLY